MRPDESFLEAAHAVAIVTGLPLTARHYIAAAILRAGGEATRRRIVAGVPVSISENTTIVALYRMLGEGTLVRVGHGRYRLAAEADGAVPMPAISLREGVGGGGHGFSLAGAGAP